jgi:hypothetical protein
MSNRKGPQGVSYTNGKFFVNVFKMSVDVAVLNGSPHEGDRYAFSIGREPALVLFEHQLPKSIKFLMAAINVNENPNVCEELGERTTTGYQLILSYDEIRLLEQLHLGEGA